MKMFKKKWKSLNTQKQATSKNLAQTRQNRMFMEIKKIIEIISTKYI